jgi:hypothetical protein
MAKYLQHLCSSLAGAGLMCPSPHELGTGTGRLRYSETNVSVQCAHGLAWCFWQHTGNLQKEQWLCLNDMLLSPGTYRG